MKQFLDSLGKIRAAEDAKARYAAIKAAQKAIKDVNPKDNDVDFGKYAEYGEWVTSDIPTFLAETAAVGDDHPLLLTKKKNRLQKRLYSFLRVVSVHNQMTNELAQELIHEIQHCKKLETLEVGYKIKKTRIPSLAERIEWVKERGATEEQIKKLNECFLKQQIYLIKKQRADRIALGITLVLSLLGVGVICGIAMMLVLPVMPLGAFIATLIGFSLLGGYVEAYVFHGYIKRFCRNVVRGFFDSIENNIINREIEHYSKEVGTKLNDRHDLELLPLTQADEIKNKILQKHKTEIWVKRACAIAAIPVAVAAGVGFTALAFTQMLSLLPIIGIVGGVAAVAMPWAFAAIVGPLYAIVMYSMIYKAIKDNIFQQIKEHVVTMFGYRFKDENQTWKDLSWQEQAKHIGFCLLKGLGIAVVLGISILATVFTAGAWLQSSVTFFSAAIGVVNSVAETIGLAIGAVLLFTNFWFSLENSLQTAKHFMHAKGSQIKQSLYEIFTDPKEFFKFTLNFGPFAIHLAGSGAVSSQGAEAFVLKDMLGNNPVLNRSFAGVSEILEEGAVDVTHMPGMEHKHAPHIEGQKRDRKHEKKHHHDHSHGDAYKGGKQVVKWAEKTTRPLREGVRHLLFGEQPVKTKKVPKVALRPYKLAP